MTTRILITATLAWLGCVSAAPAQVEWLAVAGAEGGDLFGRSVDRIDDLTGDGVAELVVGSPEAGVTFGAAGRASVIDGATGAELFSMAGAGIADRLGSCVVGLGDLDGDGLRDFAVGAPFADAGGFLDAGRVDLISSADFSVIGTLAGQKDGAFLGLAVAPAGDVDRDGIGDVVVGGASGGMLPAPEPKGPLLFSGATPDLWLATPHSPTASVVGVGDVDDDGHEDLVFANGPFARTVSGATGAELALMWSVQYGASSLGFGYSVEAAGDLDDDGCPDFYAGGNAGSGVVIAIDGCDESAFFIIDGEGAEQLGTDVESIGDVNGDGLRDVAIGAPFADVDGVGLDAGRVLVVDGRDGEVLVVLTGTTAGERFGTELADPGDVDADGTGDLVVASPWAEFDADQASAGVVRTFVELTPWSSLGSALAGEGGAPRLRATGPLLALAPTTLRLDAAPPRTPVRFVIGFEVLDLPFQGGTLVPSPDIVLDPLLTDLDGRLELTAPWPASVPADTTLVVQAWIVQGDAPSASNAVQGTSP